MQISISRILPPMCLHLLKVIVQSSRWLLLIWELQGRGLDFRPPTISTGCLTTCNIATQVEVSADHVWLSIEWLVRFVNASAIGRANCTFYDVSCPCVVLVVINSNLYYINVSFTSTQHNTYLKERERDLIIKLTCLGYWYNDDGGYYYCNDGTCLFVDLITDGS